MIKRGVIYEQKKELEFISGVLILNFEIKRETVVELFNELSVEEQESKVNRMICNRYLNGPRRKRGLLDIGGQVLHAVFGTATDRQIDETKADIKVLSVQIDRLHKETELTRRALRVHREILNQTEKIWAEKNLVEKVLQLCISYDRLREDARNKELTTRELDGNLIEREIEKFRLKNKLEPVGHWLGHGFQGPLISTVVGEMIVVSILFTNKETFSHTLLRPVPMMINRNRVSIEIRNKDVCLSADGRMIGFPEEDVIDNCVNFQKKKYCKQILLFKMTNIIGRCETQIILQKKLSNCTVRKLDKDHTEIVTTQNRLYVFDRPGEVVTMQCDRKTEQVEIPESGVLRTLRGCTIISKKFTYIDTKILEERQPNAIDYTPDINNVIELDKETQQLIQSKLETEAEITQTSDWKWEVQGIPEGVDWALLPICFLLGLIVAAMVGRHYRHKKKQAVEKKDCLEVDGETSTREVPIELNTRTRKDQKEKKGTHNIETKGETTPQKSNIGARQKNIIYVEEADVL